MHHFVEVAVVLARRHEAEAAAGPEYDDVDHEGGGKVPGAGVGDDEGLRHFVAPVLWRGSIPLDRRLKGPMLGRDHLAGGAEEAARMA